MCKPFAGSLAMSTVTVWRYVVYGRAVSNSPRCAVDDDGGDVRLGVLEANHSASGLGGGHAQVVGGGRGAEQKMGVTGTGTLALGAWESSRQGGGLDA